MNKCNPTLQKENDVREYQQYLGPSVPGKVGGDGCLRNLLANKEIKLLKSPLLSGGDTNMTDSYLTNGDTQVVLTSGHCSHQAGTRCNDTPPPSPST